MEVPKVIVGICLDCNVLCYVFSGRKNFLVNDNFRVRVDRCCSCFNNAFNAHIAKCALCLDKKRAVVL